MSDLGPIAQELNFNEICDAHREVYATNNDHKLTDDAWAGLTALYLVLDKPSLMMYICDRWMPEEVARVVLHEKNILLGDT